MVSQMPPGTTPESFLLELLADLNGAVNDPGFDAMNVFQKAPGNKPRVGQVICIDILGPDNGCVIVAVLTPTFLIFQTVVTPSMGTHPEYSSREFGFERLGDQVRFYTRGVSRPENLMVRIGGIVPQMISWTRLCRGLSNAIEKRGGVVVPDSFISVRETRG